ncbi:MAG: lipoyl(octanoyl) transferase LipB [Saprospiraceae bacterium]|nr:lipoyl(octanoyl) transferase LipB [Saprospiraceae bacterium]
MKTTVYFRDLGLIDYQEAWDFQEVLFNEIIEQKTTNNDLPKCEQTATSNHLLFCEHPHVYTLGKSGSEDNLLINAIQLQAEHAKFYKTNRGGDITYHGPGQIVGYPIFNLDNFGIMIRQYINNLEEVIILTLKEYGIKGERLEGATGVWLDIDKAGKTRKICAMGVRTSRWVTMHGFAFNINTDLKYFNYINPCGFTDKSVTSLEKELGEKQDVEEVKKKLKMSFERVFDVEILN